MTTQDTAPALLLSELVEEFCASLQKEKPASEETQARYRDGLNTMVQILGDREITGYTRQDLLDLKVKLYRWPANLERMEELRGKSAGEILRMKIARPLDRRTVDTRYMEKIFALFRYGFSQGMIPNDISQNLIKTLTVAEKKANKRKPYDIEDLKKIFQLAPVHPERPHLAWIPLIAAYSGVRPGEICRLRVDNIHVSQEVPFMLVTEEDDQGNPVKNAKGEESYRLVPLHPVLVDMGFLEFVSKRKGLGRELLFELRLKGSEEPAPLTGAYYASSFELFNRKHITHDLRKSFYSFRYNVHRALQEKGISLETCYSITGHLPQFESPQTCENDPRLAEKYSALKQLEYPEIDLAAFKERLGRLFA